MAVPTDDHLLKYAVGNDMIDISYIRQQYEMENRKKILKKHPYKIWQGNNGRWYSYILERGSDKRKQISSKNREEVENIIIENLRTLEDNPTVEDIFIEWIDKKTNLEEISLATRTKYICDYKRFFTEFGKKKITYVTPYDIEDFIKESIHKYKLSAKGYSGLRLLLYGIFKTAHKKQLISYRVQDVVNDIEFSRNTFAKKKRIDRQQVYTQTEEDMVIDYIMTNPDITGYAILLLFKTGLRVGEISALKWCDVEDDLIHVRRTETKYYDDDHNRIIEVAEHTKTEAGIRDVYIPKSTKELIHKIRILNPFGEYMFMNNGKRTTTSAISSKLRRICKKVGMEYRSPHKIRKTYGTKLYDCKEVPESFICNQMGHTDISCLQKYYYFDLMTDAEKVDVINAVNL